MSEHKSNEIVAVLRQAQHRDLHSHMMVVAHRAADAVTKNRQKYASQKEIVRAICAAIQSDKNLIAKLNPQPKASATQEPVAWWVTSEDEGDVCFDESKACQYALTINGSVTPLYTHPPQRSEDAKQPKAEQDWLLLEATQESLREHMAMVRDLQAKLAKQEPKRRAEHFEPLTLDQITEIFSTTKGLDFYLNFARAIEAAHGIYAPLKGDE